MMTHAWEGRFTIVISIETLILLADKILFAKPQYLRSKCDFETKIRRSTVYKQHSLGNDW